MALDRIHPDDRAEVARRLDMAFRKKEDVELLFRVILPDGTLKYLKGIGHPVADQNGEATELIGASMDVTEQHETRMALEKAFERNQGAQRPALQRESAIEGRDRSNSYV